MFGMLEIAGHSQVLIDQILTFRNEKFSVTALDSEMLIIILLGLLKS